jgi:hypothetical protein
VVGVWGVSIIKGSVAFPRLRLAFLRCARTLPGSKLSTNFEMLPVFPTFNPLDPLSHHLLPSPSTQSESNLSTAIMSFLGSSGSADPKTTFMNEVRQEYAMSNARMLVEVCFASSSSFRQFPGDI